MDSVSHTPRARVKHGCDCCAGTIWPGETYRRETVFYDGRVDTWKTCTDCDQLANRVWHWAIRPEDGIAAEDYEDWARSYSTTPEARPRCSPSSPPQTTTKGTRNEPPRPHQPHRRRSRGMNTCARRRHRHSNRKAGSRMVNMVGFHHREPQYNTALYGQPEHYFRILKRPKDGYPDRAYVSNPCGRFLYDNEEDAKAMIKEEPIQACAARFYIFYLHGGPDRIEYGQPGYAELGE